MLCVDSLPGADAGRWARPSHSIVPKDKTKEASAWGQVRLVHTSRRKSTEALAAIQSLQFKSGWNLCPLCRRKRTVSVAAAVTAATLQCPLFRPTKWLRYLRDAA